MNELLPSEPVVLRSNDNTLELRPLITANAERIFELIEGSPENMSSYDPKAGIRYVSPDAIRDFISEDNSSGVRSFGIWDVSETVEDSVMVGIIELNCWGQEGYTATWVGPAYRRRGYATRAARLLIDFAFNALGLSRIIRTVSQGNIPSIRTTEKLGFALLRINEKGLMTFILKRQQDHD